MKTWSLIATNSTQDRGAIKFCNKTSNYYIVLKNRSREHFLRTITFVSQLTQRTYVENRLTLRRDRLNHGGCWLGNLGVILLRTIWGCHNHGWKWGSVHRCTRKLDTNTWNTFSHTTPGSSPINRGELSTRNNIGWIFTDIDQVLDIESSFNCF